MIVQQMNVTTKEKAEPTIEVVHIELKTGQATFDSCRADGNLSLDDVGGVTVALQDITAAFVSEGIYKIQVMRGHIYNVTCGSWRMIIDSRGLVRCDEAMGDFVTPLEICPCRACMGAF